MKRPQQLVRLGFKLVLNIYRYGLSPLIHLVVGPGMGCRFQPTCSEYCSEAVEARGICAGLALGLGRVARCHPWGGNGFDPVPEIHVSTTKDQLRKLDLIEQEGQ